MSKRSARAREALREENGNTEAAQRAEEEARAQARAAAEAQLRAEAEAEAVTRARAAATSRAAALQQADHGDDDEASGYGDDDFEDYGDDDFDDDDGSDDGHPAAPESPGGARELARAIRQENARLDVPAPAPKMAPPAITMLPQREVVMVETKVATRVKADRKALSRSRTRWRDLVDERLITLGQTSIDMLDRAPCSLWEVECAFGTTGRIRRSVQTGEDNVAMETQTDKPSMRSCSMQSPDDLGLAPGQTQLGAGLVSQTALVKGSKAARLLVPHDRGKLSAFLSRVLPVVETMLPASSLRIAAPFTSETVRGDNNLSVCYSTLPAPPPLEGNGPPMATRDVFYLRTINAGGDDNSKVAVAYGVANGPGLDEEGEDRSGLVCVWDAHDTREPKESLRCMGAVTCCWMGHLSGSKATGAPVVVAGTEAGSLALWDLGQARDVLGSSSRMPAFRWPAYSTDAHRAAGANHSAPIVCVRQCPNADDSELAKAVAMSLAGSGHSFSEGDDGTEGGGSSAVQVATMDTTG